MRILGLSAGDRGGSAEILLKEALRAAEDTGVEVDLVRVDDLELRVGTGAATDDAQWFWDQLMVSDGLIVSSPIYTRTIPGKLRLLGDKISGPQADVAFTNEILRMRAAGEEMPVQFAVDERVCRPRVAGFLSVGGSIPPRWKTLALPLMHTLTASMEVAVVDQVQFARAGTRASIVLEPEALERAARLGRNVASQLGRAYDDAQYLGEPGLCPLCHLDVITVTADGVECATCGAAGAFRVVDGVVNVEFAGDGLRTSMLAYEEKLDHFHEVMNTAKSQSVQREFIDGEAKRFAEWDRTLVPPRD